MKPVISVIIPVFNVEKYIVKCLNSLLIQTFSNFEVILVDDGSPDNSVAVAKQTAAGDQRFYFYHKVNEGQGVARNFGFEHSVGDYVVFLDSDDFYEPAFLEKMYEKILDEDADICICDIRLVREDDSLIRIHESGFTSSISGREAFQNNLNMGTLLSLPQNKMMKRSIFEQAKYPKGFFYEDKATAYKHFYFSEKIAFVNEPLFNYVQRAGSTTNSFNTKRIEDRFTVLNSIKSFLVSENIYNELKLEYYSCYLIYLPLSGGVQISVYSDKKYKSLKELEERLDKKIYTLANILNLRRTHFKKMLALLLIKYCKPMFIYLAKREKQKNFQ